MQSGTPGQQYRSLWQHLDTDTGSGDSECGPLRPISRARNNNLSAKVAKDFTIHESYHVEANFQVFNLLNSSAAVSTNYLTGRDHLWCDHESDFAACWEVRCEVLILRTEWPSLCDHSRKRRIVWSEASNCVLPPLSVKLCPEPSERAAKMQVCGMKKGKVNYVFTPAAHYVAPPRFVIGSAN